jgi:hypothetical protein
MTQSSTSLGSPVGFEWACHKGLLADFIMFLYMYDLLPVDKIFGLRLCWSTCHDQLCASVVWLKRGSRWP